MGDSTKTGRTARRLTWVWMAAQLVAFWPVWNWCALRAANTEEGFWCFLPITTLLLLLYWEKTKDGLAPADLKFPSFLLALYAATFPFVPPLIRAVLAMLTIAFTVSRLYRNTLFNFGIAGLLLVALPAVSTFQVYFGFHLRLAATHLTAPLHCLSGFPVVAEGTVLNWNGQQVLVDAPCSGIKMLWAGFFLTFALASIQKLGNLQCAALAVATLTVVVLGNVLRAAGLFFLEAGVINGPVWAHDALGGVAFLITALSLLYLACFIGRVNRCAPSTLPAAS